MKAALSDFPDWMGPMLVKELRQGLKTRAFEWTFIALQLLLAIAFTIQAVISWRERDSVGSASYQAFSGIFWFIVGAQLLVITPIRALREIALERTGGTLELLLLSGLNARRITFGKWSAQLFQATLLLLAILPYAVLRYFLGGVNLVEDLRTLVIQLGLCAILSACALGFSAHVRRKGTGGAAVMFGLILLPRLSRGLINTGFTTSLTGLPAAVFWLLLIFDGAILCLAALEMGAGAIAPIGDNHVAWKRGLVLLAWLPVPIMSFAGLPEDAVDSQLGFFAVAAGILLMRDLFLPPRIFQNAARRFPGWRIYPGMALQPTWPSTVVFIVFLVTLVLVRLFLPGSEPSSQSVASRAIMVAILLFSLCLIWVILSFRDGASLGRKAFLYSASFIALLLPILALCLPNELLEDRLILNTGLLGLFALYAGVLLHLSRPYWRRFFAICRPDAPPAAGRGVALAA